MAPTSGPVAFVGVEGSGVGFNPGNGLGKGVATRWNSTLSSKVNLHHAINVRASVAFGGQAFGVPHGGLQSLRW